jgi:deoxyadenosine/deoxycytidine kinase
MLTTNTFNMTTIYNIEDATGAINSYLQEEKGEKAKLVSLEGNIGAGKSTIINQLKEIYKDNTDIVFLLEPTDTWETFRDKQTNTTILHKFYEDQRRYAFTFQVMAYSTRLSLMRKTIRENPDCKVILCERSLDADKEVFAKMLREYGLMEEVEHAIYLQFFREYSNEISLDAILYLDVSPEICFERIRQRAREGEMAITVAYLKRCKLFHDDWLRSGNLRFP